MIHQRSDLLALAVLVILSLFVSIGLVQSCRQSQQQKEEIEELKQDVEAIREEVE